ncbi:hypothetical protein K461DRAFT_158996 [Myriangium duriaei CBS 260.36]|uniref:Uncharacterized protein n=1 Tax=Myriangium duriaei CBS 260.36 TaxID=1168546 RepID=A0A9P4MG99_9PEZI|nr:hypothetical protein K461DRAFT_158996 [Myriangium duriaei CBS 260.36]
MHAARGPFRPKESHGLSVFLVLLYIYIYISYPILPSRDDASRLQSRQSSLTFCQIFFYLTILFGAAVALRTDRVGGKGEKDIVIFVTI